MYKKKNNRHLKENKIAYAILIILLLGFSIYGLIIINKYVGFAGVEIPGLKGVITKVLIDDRRQAVYWHGLFGLVFSETGWNESQYSVLEPGELSSKIFVFDCVDPNQDKQELYATLNESIDFDNLRAGSPEMIDDILLNLTNDTVYRANNTFTEFVDIKVGSRAISNIPGVYTFVNDKPDTNGSFFTGILNDSGNLVLVGRVFTSSRDSFKGTSVRYQMLLPVPNSSLKWYFFSDPNDVCPPNYGVTIQGDSYLTGYVLESNSLIPIENAYVSAGPNSTYTDSGGFYNMTVPGDMVYNLVSIKEGYITNITQVNTSIGYATYQNLTMPKFYGFINDNATISGYTKDNITNEIVPNVTISVQGLIAHSNESGNYSLSITAGTYYLAAVKSGYENFIGNFSIAPLENLSYIINMTEIIEGKRIINGTLLNNGTVEGYIIDNSTNLTIENVTVSIQGLTALSNASGFYNISALEGLSNLVATKEGYEAYSSPVNISQYNITFHNFSMEPVVIIDRVINGSVTGIVRTSGGSIIDDVFIGITGRHNYSNVSGGYFISNVPVGTHNIIATKSGYENYYASVNISSGNITEHNITLYSTIEIGLGAGQGPGLGPGDGPGDGPGQGPGQGPGTAVRPQIELPIVIREFEVSIKKIIRKLKKGTYITVPFTISNYIEDPVNIVFSFEGSIKDIARINVDKLRIDGASDEEVTLTFIGNKEPGIYEGFLVIAGDIEEKIPIYILLMERDRLDVEALLIDLKTEKTRFNPGSSLKYRIDLQNKLEEEKYKVSLEYVLEGITTNESILIEKEEIAIFTSFTLQKSFEIPDDIEIGDYALKVIATYLDFVTEEVEFISIELPFYRYAVFGLIPLWLLFLIILLLSSGTYGVVLYKKKQAEKQRYKIEVDYNQLPKPGPRSAYVGVVAETEKKAYFDLEQLTIHTLVAGSTGGGKTVAAQGIVEEALLKNTAVIVFDPTVQWTGFLRRCQDKRFLNLYPKFGYKKTDARAFNGNIKQVTDAREIIEFRKIMKPGEINVFVANKLEVRDYEIFVSNVIRQIFHENLPESRQLKLILIFDEFHRLLPKYGGTGEVLIQVERATREFRKWGVGLVLISQVISDFQAEVLANINTQIQMRTKDEGDLNRIKEEYGENLLKSLVKASVGAGMVENSAYNKGKPYFIQFRPLLHSTVRLSDEELANYNKYNGIIDDIDYQLEELEKEGVDVFDLRLELKLAQDKVKSGSFNMVDIYLEGLKPRVADQWKKTGKKPRKKKLKLVSREELEEEKKIVKEEIEKEKKNDDEADEKEADSNATPSENNDPEKSLDNLLKEISEAINAADKKKSFSYYPELQKRYKTADIDSRKKIIKIINEIKQKFS